MIRSLDPIFPMIVELETTPEERQKALQERDRYLANIRRYEQLADDIGREHAGRFICIAGGELIVGGDPVEVHARARAAHPDDAGSFFSKYVSPHRGAKIYANSR